MGNLWLVRLRCVGARRAIEEINRTPKTRSSVSITCPSPSPPSLVLFEKKRRRRRQFGGIIILGSSRMDGSLLLVKVALADAVITCMWVFSVSTLGVLVSIVSSALQIQGQILPTLLLTTSFVFVLVFVFGLLGAALGGASFNPTGPASFYAAGFGAESLFSIALRLPAQAAGAVGGALAIMEFMPPKYKHMLGGPSLKVDLHTGAIVEGVLTFIISFAVLFIILKGPKSLLLKNWLLAMSTVALVVTGSGYTGPAMNPANAFGWAYVNSRHNTWEHLYVYWVCPFIGATLAAWIYRFVFSPGKQKKA